MNEQRDLTQDEGWWSWDLPEAELAQLEQMYTYALWFRGETMQRVVEALRRARADAAAGRAQVVALTGRDAGLYKDREEDYWFCTACEAEQALAEEELPFLHEPECPIAQARAWLAAPPEED